MITTMEVIRCLIGRGQWREDGDSNDNDNEAQTWEWGHIERDGVSNHRRVDCLFNRLFGRRSQKTSKLRVTGLCEENSPVNWWIPRTITRKTFPFDDVIVKERRAAFAFRKSSTRRRPPYWINPHWNGNVILKKLSSLAALEAGNQCVRGNGDLSLACMGTWKVPVNHASQSSLRDAWASRYLIEVVCWARLTQFQWKVTSYLTEHSGLYESDSKDIKAAFVKPDISIAGK